MLNIATVYKTLVEAVQSFVHSLNFLFAFNWIARNCHSVGGCCFWQLSWNNKNKKNCSYCLFTAQGEKLKGKKYNIKIKSVIIICKGIFAVFFSCCFLMRSEKWENILRAVSNLGMMIADITLILMRQPGWDASK